MEIVWTTGDQISQYRAGPAFLGDADKHCVHIADTAVWQSRGCVE